MCRCKKQETMLSQLHGCRLGKSGTVGKTEKSYFYSRMDAD